MLTRPALRHRSRNCISNALSLLMFISIIVSATSVAHAQEAPAGVTAAFADKAQQAVPALGAPFSDFPRPRRVPRNIPGTQDFYWAQRFTEGMITYTPRTGLQVVAGTFFRAWMRFNTEAGLGLPTSAETVNNSGNRFQMFEKGLIYLPAKTDVPLVAFKADALPALPPGAPPPAVSLPIDPRVAITRRGLAAGLGLPRPESLAPVRTPQPRNNGFWQAFGGGWVYAREGDVPFIVRMPIFGEWGGTGWEQGALGFPISDARTLAPRPGIIAPPGSPRPDWPEEQFPNDRVQFFERGAIYFHASTNRTEVLTPDFTGETREALALFSSASPNIPYGLRSGAWSDPGGKFVGVVARRSNVWAASEDSGVWRSADEGHTWRQTVVGLTSGYSQSGRGAIPLAVDEIGNRLLYATGFTDFRVSRLDGLFKTLDGGNNWQRVTFNPAVCSDNATAAVAFSYNNALALTGSCGLLRTDLPDLTGWRRVTTPEPFTTIAASPAFSHIYGCAGSAVYLSTDDGATWSAPLRVNGNCGNISVPNPRGGRKAVVLYGLGDSANTIEVATLDFGGGSVTVNNFSRPFIAIGGKGFVQAIARPGSSGSGTVESIDMFAGNGFELFFSSGGAAWERVEGLHSDPWDVAFKPGYSPELGRCGAYLANDGGIYANDFRSAGSCVTRDGPWVLAQNGLHALNVFGAGGARLPASVVVINRDGSTAPPPNALYLSTAHNGSWAYSDRSSGSESWNVVTRIPRPRESLTGPQLANLGDSGTVALDPALPNFAVFARGEFYRWFRNDDVRTPPNSSSPHGDMSPPAERWLDPPVPPIVASLSQVLTPPGLSPLERSDFFAFLVSASPAGATWRARVDDPTGVDDVVRNTNLAGWSSLNLTPSQLLCTTVNFGCRFMQIQAVRRSSDTALFLLGADGQLRRLLIDSSNRVTASSIILGAPNFVMNFVVNPYDFNEIYVSEVTSSRIMVTRNGVSWTNDDFLTQLATNNGEFGYFNCRPTNGTMIVNCTGINASSLQSVIFSKDALNVRVVLLLPSNAIAYSNSSGRNWTALSRHVYGEGDVDFLRTPKDLLGLNTSGFFIPHYRGGGVLYVAYNGRGLMRIDAPFEYLP